MCDAIIEDYAHGKSYNLSRSFTIPEHRPCAKAGKEKVGPLLLCANHAKMAREGLIDKDGTVAAKSSIADVRRYPKKFPNGLYSWAKEETNP